MSLHDDPSLLVIPISTKFPTTDYSTKLLLARQWVRKRHPDGPVAVYSVGSKRAKAASLRSIRPIAVEPPDIRQFLVPPKE